MKKFILLLAILTSVISCTKEEEKGLDLTITGFVKLVDDKGIELFDNSNIKVSVQGSTASVLTDKYGKFLFTGLRSGIAYNFDFTKDGYGSKSAVNYKFIGDQKPGLLGTITLYQIPTIELNSASLQFINNGITINGLITPSNIYLISAFANDSSNVSDTHYDYSAPLGTYSATGFELTSVYTRIPMDNNRYATGTTIYVAIYFYNSYEVTNWDSERNTWIRTTGKKAGLFNLTL